MEKLTTENLFLLEFLVDDVKMDGKCDCDTPPGDHCVSFQFLDNDPLDVCEADFTPKRQYGRDDSTKSGKSCLFSLTPEQVVQATEIFDITVSVYKKMQPGWLPEKILVGNALISISNLFIELVRSVEMQEEQAPSAKTLKDTFTLTDSMGTDVGKISIYIRMSCFGKLIVTQFQMNLDDKSVLFKDKGGQSLYRYKKAGRPEDEPPCAGDMGGMQMQPPFPMGPPPQMFNQNMNYPPPNPTCPNTPCFPPQGQGMFQDPGMFCPGMQDGGMFPPQSPQSTFFPPNSGQSMMLPCSECNMMMPMSPYQGNQNPPCFSPDSQMLSPCEECGTLLAPKFEPEVCEPPPDGPGNYQEIGASMGGNALTIRVHKDKKKIEQVEGTGSVTSEGSCGCTPGNIGVRKPKKEPPCLAITPQSYNMNPGVKQGDQHLPFSVKMGGAGPSNNNVIVNPPVCTKPDGTKVMEISDPNKEMFVLRIGKKSEGVQKKANLELELCTPRGPELKPIPRKETRDCQYDPKDCAGAGGGKKKGKGKKGKDKKSKKGGKGKGKGGKGKGKKGKKKK